MIYIKFKFYINKKLLYWVNTFACFKLPFVTWLHHYYIWQGAGKGAKTGVQKEQKWKFCIQSKLQLYMVKWCIRIPKKQKSMQNLGCTCAKRWFLRLYEGGKESSFFLPLFLSFIDAIPGLILKKCHRHTILLKE